MKTKLYQVTDGTFYHGDTPEEVIDVLERARINGTRIVLDYGDVTTGKSWGEIHNIVGRIGRSMGPVKIPILLYNRRSLGGGAILDHCIVAIYTSRGKRLLYKHPTYTPYTGVLG